MEHRWSIDPTRLGFAARGGGNLVIPLVAELAAAVRDRHGAAIAAHLHTGATSQDIHDTATALVLRRSTDRVTAGLDEIIGALRDLAAAHLDTVCVARTLSQQALPTRFGLVAAEWGWALLAGQGAVGRRGAAVFAVRGGRHTGVGRATAPMTCWRRTPTGPGCRPPRPPGTRSGRPYLRLAAALAEMGQAVGKVAGDLVLLGQTEIGETWEAERPPRGRVVVGDAAQAQSGRRGADPRGRPALGRTRHAAAHARRPTSINGPPARGTPSGRRCAT